MFWGGREGYQTLLNTDLKKELDNMVTICFCFFPFLSEFVLINNLSGILWQATFLKLAAEYKKKLGFNGICWLYPYLSAFKFP